MKEIIYIQAGQYANFTGTHFWNTQEAYFTYGEDEQSEIDHDVSFREGSTLTGDSTYSPRLLLFDGRSNFGTLSRTSGLYNSADSDLRDEPLWNGTVVEYCQEEVPQSSYHEQLEREAEEGLPGNDNEQKASPQVSDSEVRFWSDYSRVFLHPRSSQRLPEPPDWEGTEGNWLWSKETFERHNADTDLMEGSFRLFVEECDNLQGIQVMNDTSTFGGFTSSFLTAYQDEFPKLPCLVLPILSHSLPSQVSTDDEAGMRSVVNDAMYLHDLASLATLIAPLQTPATWMTAEWLDGVDIKRESKFQTSAILSTHVESATLPLRLKASMEDLDSLCGVLNCSGTYRFAHLSGVFPLSSPLDAARDLARRFHDFSLMPEEGGQKSEEDTNARLEFARIYVARGFSSSDRRTLDAWTETRRPFPYTAFAPAYPLPSSFPRFLVSPPAPTGDSLRVPTTRTLSSLHTTPHTSEMLSAYSAVVDDCVRRSADVLGALGLEKDDATELRDELWALRDAYAGMEDGGTVNEVLGLDEDEE